MPSPRDASDSAGAARLPRLTVSEVHQVVLRLLELAAIREGGSLLPVGTPLFTKVEDALIRIDAILKDALLHTPLAATLAKSGHVAQSFTEWHFEYLKAYEQIVGNCRDQRRLLRQRLKGGSHVSTYSRTVFVSQLKAALSPLVRVREDSLHATVEAIEPDLVRGSLKPSQVAGKVMERYRLPKERSAQALKLLSAKARSAKAKRGRGLEIAVREFLTCLQVPQGSVNSWSMMLLTAVTLPGAELRLDLPSAAIRNFGSGRPRLTGRRRRPDYSLADAWPFPEVLGPDKGPNR
jgi:hypothetical protein